MLTWRNRLQLTISEACAPFSNMEATTSSLCSPGLIYSCRIKQAARLAANEPGLSVSLTKYQSAGTFTAGIVGGCISHESRLKNVEAGAWRKEMRLQ